MGSSAVSQLATDVATSATYVPAVVKAPAAAAVIGRGFESFEDPVFTLGLPVLEVSTTAAY